MLEDRLLKSPQTRYNPHCVTM